MCIYNGWAITSPVFFTGMHHVVMSLFLMLYRRQRSVKFLTIIQAGKVIRHKSVCTCAVKKQFTGFVAFLHVEISYWQAFYQFCF